MSELKPVHIQVYGKPRVIRNVLNSDVSTFEATYQGHYMYCFLVDGRRWYAQCSPFDQSMIVDGYVAGNGYKNSKMEAIRMCLENVLHKEVNER